MQIWFNGICNGMLIALLATAFSIVYTSTGVFYIALAGIYVFSAYAAMQMLEWGMHWIVVCVGTLACGAFLSVLFDCLNHRVLQMKNASKGAHLISSLGLYMILVELAALIWGNDPQSLKLISNGVFVICGITVTFSQAVILIIGMVAITGLLFWINYSGLGLKLRALSNNPQQLALLGSNTLNVRISAFGLAGALAAAVGILNGYDLGFDTHIGMPALMLAVIASIIGGRNSLAGPVVGGIILGLVRSQVTWYMSAEWQDMVTFVILAFFLFCRPGGIFGSRERLEVQ